jgi:hypothetical protein
LALSGHSRKRFRLSAWSKPTSHSTKNQAHLKEKSRPSPSLSPVRQLSVGLPHPPAGDQILVACAFFSSFSLCKDRHNQCGFWGAENRFSKRKAGWLLLLMGSLASLPPMLMNRSRPSRERGSLSTSWMDLGRRDAVKLAARLQKMLTYYQTIFGGNSICGATRANGTAAFGGRFRWVRRAFQPGVLGRPECPPLAQSRHGLVHRTCPFWGVKRTLRLSDFAAPIWLEGDHDKRAMERTRP